MAALLQSQVDLGSFQIPLWRRRSTLVNTHMLEEALKRNAGTMTVFHSIKRRTEFLELSLAPQGAESEA